MRIISGRFRGKKLNSPKHNIRPTLDMVKQAIFTRLQFFVPNKKVLDLFSGSGALGIEALSRDASEVVFCDKNNDSIELIKNNLKLIDAHNYKVIKGDFKDVLCKINCKFDLILLDPPFASGYYNEALKLIYENELLNKDGIIVCERAKEECIKCDYFILDCTKIYGSVAIDYYMQGNV